MRTLISVALAGAIFAATPALAQNDAAPAANTAETNAVADNVAKTMPANSVAMLGEENASLPSGVSTSAQPVLGRRRGFPWGVLGLLGLVGLFGRKRSS